MKIEISGEPAYTPQQRILAVEQAVQAICKNADAGPDDAVMVLLTAAAHIAMVHAGKSADELMDKLAYALGYATVSADQFFPPSTRPLN